MRNATSTKRNRSRRRRGSDRPVMFLIFIAIGILLACVCVGFTLNHELDRANRQKRWEDEHPEAKQDKKEKK